MRRCCVRVVFRFFLLAFVLATLSIASIAQLGGGGVDVLTWHNDNYRTGDNLSESVLTAGAITANYFGKLCTANKEVSGSWIATALATTMSAMTQIAIRLNKLRTRTFRFTGLGRVD